MNFETEKIPLGKILRPSPKEFKNFKKYIYKVYNNKNYKDCGIIKIIPPFTSKLPQKIKRKLNSTLTVKNPILQELYGSNGNLKRSLQTKANFSKKSFFKRLQKKS